MSAACVVTTIYPPTAAVKQWHERLGDRLIVIGDRKTPTDWQCGDARYLSIDQQKNLPLDSLQFTPENHYARKNIGYLQAILLGSSEVWDTDDDNSPNENWAQTQEIGMADVISEPGWCNVYTHLVRDPNIWELYKKGTYKKYAEVRQLWPRGLPLNHIRDPRQEVPMRQAINSPIQQCLANGQPDVDAVSRLVDPTPHTFELKRSVALRENVWCPFNSQATWWFPEAFELMYLPIHATFRMTDIWRSFVAQRCLWAMGKSVVFHSPAEVVQDRNIHDLMDDFISELPGYIHNEKIAAALEKLPLKNGNENGRNVVAENMRACYAAVVELGVLPKEELASLDAWLADVRRVRHS